jgi:hypothetical protein
MRRPHRLPSRPSPLFLAREAQQRPLSHGSGVSRHLFGGEGAAFTWCSGPIVTQHRLFSPTPIATIDKELVSSYKMIC